eukprot:1062169-Rhodomonas_salina.1
MPVDVERLELPARTHTHARTPPPKRSVSTTQARAHHAETTSLIPRLGRCSGSVSGTRQAGAHLFADDVVLGGFEDRHGSPGQLLHFLASVLVGKRTEQSAHLLGIGRGGREAEREGLDPLERGGPERARVGVGAVEEVEEERVGELQALALLDRHHQRRRKLLLRLLLRRLRPHDDHLVRPELCARCRLAPPVPRAFPQPPHVSTGPRMPLAGVQEGEVAFTSGER